MRARVRVSDSPIVETGRVAVVVQGAVRVFPPRQLTERRDVAGGDLREVHLRGDVRRREEM